MGDRYTMEVTCKKCGHVDDDAWYAPTCGAITTKCEKCGYVTDLEEYSGIDAVGCANTEYGVKAVEDIKKSLKEKETRQ